MRKYIVVLFVVLLGSLNAYSKNYIVDHPRIAYVENLYDDIHLYLEKYNIVYDLISYKELENPELYKKYDVIYYPSGIEKEINTSINILSRARRIKGVTRKQDFYRIKDEKIADLMKTFVSSGGIAVCSGYSAKFFQKAFECFKLYKDFPNLGLAGPAQFSVKGDLAVYVYNNYTGYLSYDGYWVASDLKKGEVLLEGNCNTPFGVRRNISGVKIAYNDGFAYYLGYLGDAAKDEIVRYLSYNIYYTSYIDKMNRLMTAWQQELVDYVIDKNYFGDNSRQYSLDVKEGANTLYMFFESGKYQIDILDENRNLLYSKNNVEGTFEKSINFKKNTNIFLKIFSDGGENGGVYIAGIGFGKRYIPYYSRILIGLGVLTAVIILTLLLQRERYSGRY